MDWLGDLCRFDIHGWRFGSKRRIGQIGVFIVILTFPVTRLSGQGAQGVLSAVGQALDELRRQNEERENERLREERAREVEEQREALLERVRQHAEAKKQEAIKDTTLSPITAAEELRQEKNSSHGVAVAADVNGELFIAYNQPDEAMARHVAHVSAGELKFVQPKIIWSTITEAYSAIVRTPKNDDRGYAVIGYATGCKSEEDAIRQAATQVGMLEEECPEVRVWRAGTKARVESHEPQRAVIDDRDPPTNVRAARSRESKVKATIAEEEQFVVYPSDNEWWAVLLNDHSCGFIHRSCVRLLDSRKAESK